MGKKILVVEDEAIIAHELQLRLQHMGYDVPYKAANGEGAIDICRARASQIRPMASHHQTDIQEEDHQQDIYSAPLPLPKPPSFDTLPMLEVVEAPSTPKGRIDRIRVR